jgi:uncharacterized membrane protein YjdF
MCDFIYFDIAVEDSVVLDGILSYWAVVTMLLVSSAVLLPLVLLLYQLMGFHAMLGMILTYFTYFT